MNLRKILKALLIIFVITTPLTNRDIFSLKGEFLIPVHILTGALVIYSVFGVFGVFREGGWAKIKAYFSELLQDKIFLLLIVLWAIRIISLINSLNLRASFNLLAFYSSMIVLYVLLKFFFKKDPGFSFKLFKIYLLTVAFGALYALIQVLLGSLFNITLPGLLVGGNYYRVPGTFYDANHLPAFLITGIPFFVALGWVYQNHWQKTGVFLVAALSSLVLFLTFSRSGYVAFGTALIVITLLAAFYRYWNKLIVPISLFVFVVLVIILSDRTSHSILDRIYSIQDKSERSTQAHKLLIEGEIDLFLNSPFLGVGYGSFSEHFRSSQYGQEHLKLDPTSEIRLPAHSLWFEVLTETGILGITVYSAIMFLIVRKLLLSIRTALNKEWRLYFIALFGGVLGILAGGLFYSYNLEFFWFFLFSAYLLAHNYKSLATHEVALLEEKEKVVWINLILPTVLVVLATVLIYWDLGSTTLVDWDEAIYAAVSKNMARSREYLVPTLNGVSNFFEKPPFYMWITVPMINLFGIDSFSVRFWSAFFGVAGVLATYFLAKEMFGRLSGFLSGVVLITTFHYLRFSKMAMLDVTVTFFMTMSILLFWLGKRRGIFLILSGLALGLGFMTKGVVSFLVLPPLAVILFSDFRTYSRKYLLGFCLSFLAVTLPWHGYLIFRFGNDFINPYIGYHVGARFGSDVEGKTEPFWLYVAVIRNSLRLWFPLLPLALIWLVGQLWLGKPSGSLKRKGFLLLLAWFLAIFLPLSIAHSKLIWYIVPIYPVLAIIIGTFLAWLMSFVWHYLSNNPKFEEFSQILRRYKEERVKRWYIAIVVASLMTVSITYLITHWKLVVGADFNRDVLNLTYKKYEIDRTNRIGLYYFGVVGNPFIRYYNEGSNAHEVTQDALLGFFVEETRRFFIAEKSYAFKVLEENRKTNRYPVAIDAISGNMVLLERHGPPLKNQ